MNVELASAIGSGVSENDFIVASKIDELDLAALLPPKRRMRAWA